LEEGGDSITAMAVVARSRKHNLRVSLHDVLRCESVAQLARTAEIDGVSVQHTEKTDEPFGLSPIQKLYLQRVEGYQGRSRFNQSLLLRLTRRIDASMLESAIRGVICHHSMLRARFNVTEQRVWQQHISNVCILNEYYCTTTKAKYSLRM
jgi:Condensation domain/Phosphopantetheine attachment site